MLGKFDKNVRTAVIYSIPETDEYLVEIKDLFHDYFICEKNSPKKFISLHEAKKQARKHKAKQAYLALNNVYQEAEADLECQIIPSKDNNRFDYSPIKL